MNYWERLRNKYLMSKISVKFCRNCYHYRGLNNPCPDCGIYGRTSIWRKLKGKL